uniref:C2H2-type domain-containing protein n=1 Tax=Ditylenchus dipsaci TaxID=166011 RepID=A0A915EU17_9BILA
MNEKPLNINSLLDQSTKRETPIRRNGNRGNYIATVFPGSSQRQGFANNGSQQFVNLNAALHLSNGNGSRQMINGHFSNGNGTPNNMQNRLHPRAGGNAAFSVKVRQLCDTYIESHGNAHQSFNDDDFPGQFKCTYNGCRKRLRNNVTFMYHLWAHVNKQKPNVGEDADITNLQLTSGSLDTPTEQIKDDVARLRTCPECLVMQPSPHRMHLHYHRVHKYDKLMSSQDLAICNICESVLHFANMPTHLERHGDLDLPYHCKKCRYRTSSREALFRHFLESHCGTSMLICPFCLSNFNVPITERQRQTVTMKSYVQHVMDHDLDSQYGCNRCVTRFQKCGVTSLNTRMENHSKQHKELDPKWKCTRKNIINLQRPQSKAITSSSMDLMQKCKECNHVILENNKQQLHFKELKKCRSKKCSYETCCPYAMEMHAALSYCWSENKRRWPLGKPSQLCDEKKQIMRCTKCDFETYDGSEMCEHLVQTCVGGEAKLEIPAPLDDCMKLEGWEAEQKLVVQLLGIDILHDIDPVQLEQDKNAEGIEDIITTEHNEDENFNKLSEVIPMSKIHLVKDNKVVVKHLVGGTTAAETKNKNDFDYLCLAAVDSEDIREHITHFQKLLEDED